MSDGRRIRVVVAALVPVLTVVACGAPGDAPGPAEGGPDEVVARVDGEPITRETLEALSRQLAVRRPARRDADLDDALEAWIDARLLHDELRARGLDTSDEYRARQDAILARAWRAEQELARSAVVSALEQDLRVDDEELRALYEKNAQRYLTTRLHLRQITVPDRETILGIRKQLADGADFAELARRANLDPALRQKGGDLGWVEQRKLPTALIGPAHRLVEPGELTEPFADREGRWHLVQLVAREKSARRSFDSVRDQLERELRVVRSREALAGLLEARRDALRVERLPALEETGAEAR